MINQLTCVVCPIGCKMTAVTENGKFASVSGNACPRGAKYAESEFTNPVRTLTSVVKVVTESGVKMLPVKTASPIAKDKLFEGMQQIHKIKLTSPIKVGDVIISNFIQSGVNLVACKDM